MIYGIAFAGLVLIGLLALLLATAERPYDDIEHDVDTINDLAGDQ